MGPYFWKLPICKVQMQLSVLQPHKILVRLGSHPLVTVTILGPLYIPVVPLLLGGSLTQGAGVPSCWQLSYQGLAPQLSVVSPMQS